MSAPGGEKRFEATPARKLRARREGQIARSSELGGLAGLGGGLLVVVPLVPFIGAAAATGIVDAAGHPGTFGGVAPVALLGALALAPAGGAAVGAIAANIAQAAGVRLIALKFQPSRLDPVAGLKRMFGGEALVGVARAVCALVAVLVAVVPLGVALVTQATVVGDAAACAALALRTAVRAAWVAAGVGLLFAIVDYVLARRRWLRELRMNAEELRRDQKENDGDPQTRSRRAALQRTLARGAIARTKDASFVVVNPTHIAIAIRYAPPAVAVPEILVRAADDGAQRVRALARAHAIPIVENVALARLLYAQGEAGRAIPAQTFIPVARVIAALIQEGVLT